MNCLLKKLPFDIVLRIIPYTYNLQQKQLLDDIENYTKSKTILLELYHYYWIIERREPNPEEDKNWLLNDIYGYANNNHALMFGYVDKFYDIFKRNIFLQTKQQIKKYMKNIEKKEVISQINIFLGLFTMNERNDMINVCYQTFITPLLNH
jgi:hypothetical protein